MTNRMHGVCVRDVYMCIRCGMNNDNNERNIFHRAQTLARMLTMYRTQSDIFATRNCRIVIENL